MSQAGIINISGGGGSGSPIENIIVQTGISPVVPTANTITFNGAVVTAGTNPVRTDGTGVSTMALEVQRSQAIASTNANAVGLAAFDSADFSVDVNGFVTLKSAGVFPWTDQSGAFSAVPFNGYFITNTSNSTLPSSPSQGDTISFVVDTANILTITANTGQFIRVGNKISLSSGTCVSTDRGDSITLVYRSADTTWISIPGIQGNWNIT